MEDRIQKILSSCGMLSRRGAEEAIRSGRVTVNGVPAKLGEKADLQRDEIALDGLPVLQPAGHVYLMLNKPRGYVTTLSDEKGRRTAAQLIAGCGRRVYPVGRLDLNSEGLLLFTDDGEAANRLTHPSHQVEKEYLVRVTGNAEAALTKLSQSMELDGQRLRPARVRLLKREGGSALLSIVIHEGKNRQVRRMCAQVGLNVVRLRRIREGRLRLGDLKSGCWRYLTDEEIQYLRSL